MLDVYLYLRIGVCLMIILFRIVIFVYIWLKDSSLKKLFEYFK